MFFRQFKGIFGRVYLCQKLCYCLGYAWHRWSVKVIGNKRELKQQQRWRQQERQKSNWFRMAKQQLCTCMHHAFLYISLPWLHDYNVKVPNFTFCRGRERGQRLYFSLPELWNSLLEFNSRKIHHHLTNWTKWNKRDKVWSSANSLSSVQVTFS